LALSAGHTPFLLVASPLHAYPIGVATLPPINEICKNQQQNITEPSS